jgi:hypothetical protein
VEGVLQMIKIYEKEVYQVYSKQGPRPPRKKHTSFEEACEVADIMSKKYPGQKFYVLRRFAGPYLVEKEGKEG